MRDPDRDEIARTMLGDYAKMSLNPSGHGITESIGCGSTHGKDSTSNTQKHARDQNCTENVHILSSDGPSGFLF